MEQMKIDPKYVVDVEMEGVAGLLHPTVFKEGDTYCTLLGSNPQSGVFGCGDTIAESLDDWEESLRFHLEEAKEGDEVATYVQEIIAKQPAPTHIQDFYTQFRPPKKKK